MIFAKVVFRAPEARVTKRDLKVPRAALLPLQKFQGSQRPKVDQQNLKVSSGEALCHIPVHHRFVLPDDNRMSPLLPMGCFLQKYKSLPLKTEGFKTILKLINVLLHLQPMEHSEE